MKLLKFVVMNRKIIVRFIMTSYVLFTIYLVFNYGYVITNGLKNETTANRISPTAVSADYNINAILAITVIFSFFYFLKSVKHNTRSIR